MRQKKNKLDLKITPTGKWYKEIFMPNYISRKAIYDFLMRYKDIQGKLLDYGAGNMPYKDIFKDLTEYVALDYDETGKKFFGEKNKSCTVVYYDGINIPYEDEVFDTVLSCQVLEHVKDVNNSLDEITRVLKSGGLLLLSVPHVYPHHMSPYDYRRFTVWGIEELLKERGFENISIEGSTSIKNTKRRINIMLNKVGVSQIYMLFANIFFVMEYVIHSLFSANEDNNDYFPFDLLISAKKKQIE